jgi:signal transduction histidine kinase
LAAYRITMEAVTNVIRHAQADHCHVHFHLDNGMREKRLYVEIEDDGRGLPVRLRHGVGITSMRERAEELGGCVVLAAGKNGGTHVSAELTLPQESGT